ncbi:uncharacterized protein DUF5134 [Pseudonocardia hierapolitana]|uniref:Uncharacterized protein DUF5134 n=1 Tax=Pseudonocardia hierapolitana TaxID=1128676 RepID=A0A561SLI4_9PSEU|nr:DUF5134 domain-containing protein [Pseudonocardia hierapolitana]TWF75682.1 uncharacterized protein DUF5134 [Pseudonocardia hierapolitana]
MMALVFTAAFAVAGLSSMVRLFRPVAGGGRIAAFSHLLTSIAMIGMAWGWPGPGTSVGIVQLAVFGLLAAVFVLRVLRPVGHGRGASANHLLDLVAMVWMLGAVPWLMGADHASHSHDLAAVPVWMQVVTLAFLVLLGNAALASVVEEHRSSPDPAGAVSRLDAAGRVLMSGGMAGMLLTML